MMRALCSAVVGLGLVMVGASACSDPVPPAAQGAVAVSVVNGPPPDGVHCPANFKISDIGQVNGSSSAVVSDGSGGEQVSCAVHAAGGGFDFSGRVVDPKGSTVSVNGSVTPGTSTMGSVAISANNVSLTDSACTFDITADATDTQLGAAPGRIWLKFSCDNLKDPGDAQNRPCASQGYAIFENCNQLARERSARRAARSLVRRPHSPAAQSA